jgi:hypothetical protein
MNDAAIRTCAVVALATAALLAPRAAAAQAGPWSVSFDLGREMPLSGDVHGGGAGTVLTLPTTVDARSYDDVYGPGFTWAAALGYRVTERGEIRIRGSYTSNPAEELQVGTVAGLPLLALFDDYKAFGMDVGYRQYLGASAVQPYVGADVGFVRLDAISGTFSVPAASVVLPDVDFLDSSVVPAFGVGGGVQAWLSGHLAVQAGVDFRWHGDATDLDGLAGTGLEGINDETRRWSLPVTGGVTVRF